MSKHGVELVEDRLTPTCRDVAANTTDHAADRILGVTNLPHLLFHTHSSSRIGATYEVAIDLLAVNGQGIGLTSLLFTHGADPGDDLYAIFFTQDLFGDRTGRYTTDRLAGT